VLAFLLPNLLSGDTRLGRQPLADHLAALARSSSVDALVGGARALASRPDRTATLRTMRVPALVVVGVEDTL
jgi:hypothetical protein